MTEARYDESHQRICDFGKYEKGWMGGDEPPPSEEVTIGALSLLMVMRKLGFPSPRVFPIDCGGIQFEWSTEEAVGEIAIKNDGTVEAGASDTHSNNDFDVELKVKETSA